MPESLDGLLTCGRCVSSDDAALEPLREIHVCWVTGEAAGLAAALAVRTPNWGLVVAHSANTRNGDPGIRME